MPLHRHALDTAVSGVASKWQVVEVGCCCDLQPEPLFALLLSVRYRRLVLES